MQLGLDGAFTDFPETQHNYLECRSNINASNPTSNPNATILVSADSPGGPVNASEVCTANILLFFQPHPSRALLPAKTYL